MKTSRNRAFTLIELLVAAGLTALIAGFILVISGRMMAVWSHSSGLFAAQAQARVVLDQLALDLQSALYRDDGKVWLAATVLDDPGNSGLWEPAPREKPAGSAAGSLRLAATALRDARYGQAGIWLRFFTTARDVSAASSASEPAGPFSAPVAVAYQIIRHGAGNNPTGADQKYLLYRAVVRPAQSGARPGTLETGFDLDPAEDASGYLQPDSGNDGAQLGDPFLVKHPGNPDCVLAENVVDFGLRLYRRAAGGGLQRIFPIDENDVTHFSKAPPSDPNAADCFPDVADVMVRILTEDGARLVAALESPSGRLGARPSQYLNDAEWWWGLVEANSQVFTRRIVLPAQLP